LLNPNCNVSAAVTVDVVCAIPVLDAGGNADADADIVDVVDANVADMDDAFVVVSTAPVLAVKTEWFAVVDAGAVFVDMTMINDWIVLFI